MTKITVLVFVTPDIEDEKKLVTHEVEPATTVGLLRDVVMAEAIEELGPLPSTDSVILHGGNPVADTATVASLGIGNESGLLMLIIGVSEAQLQATLAQGPRGLAGAGGAGQAGPGRRLNLDEIRRAHERMVLEGADPAQIDQVADVIRQHEVQENFQHAYDNNPESFARVTMLFINARVNGVPIKAFVDSGAQSTIMSERFAEKCGILRLLDRRFATVARGVGTANIIGRVHSAEVWVGSPADGAEEGDGGAAAAAAAAGPSHSGSSFECSFNIIEGDGGGIEFLLGLDNLRRYRANIDLRRNVLMLEDTAVSFLPESECPDLHGEGGGGGAAAAGSPAAAPPATSATTTPVTPAASSAAISSATSPTLAASRARTQFFSNLFSGGGGGAAESASGGTGARLPNRLTPADVASLLAQMASSTAAAAAPGGGGASTTTTTTTATTTTAATAPAAGAGPSAPPSAAAVEQLVGLGIPEEMARNALVAAGGNVEQAASLAFEQVNRRV